VRERAGIAALAAALPLLLAAFAGWALLSAWWSPGATLPVHEAQRGALYAAAAAAALLLVRVDDVDVLLAGIVAGVAAVSVWAIVHGRDGGQLAEPIGYWNALGAVCVLGILLAAHLALRWRWAALAALPPLVALWLTYSRGSWLALAAGAAVAAALRAGPRLRIAFAVAALAFVGVFAAGGGFEKATAAFRAPLQEQGEDLSGRLVSVSGNGRADYWRAAWHEARDHPLLGGGAGGFERRWLRERPNAFYARDAHELYLETLAELGVVGLVLLLAALAVPALGATRAPLAAGAYAAFLVHAAVDWDWELPAVTVPALLVGAALARLREPAEQPLTTRRRAIVLAAIAPLLAFAFVGQVGNSLISRARDELERSDLDGAIADADRARRWAPWSYEPWQVKAESGEGAPALREALKREPESWELWYGLGLQGDEAALARARRLNPRLSESP
jgi:O-antigen ligase